MKPYIVVIGASNIDIGGISTNKLVAEDSNPGRVSITCGGVGHNIGINLARMGVGVKFITALGSDEIGKLLLNEMDGLLDYSHSAKPKDARSSTYLFISDNDGNMNVAVNDMGIIESIDSTLIVENQDLINSAKLVVIEANLSEKTIETLCLVCQRPILADTVSTIKAPKLLKGMRNIQFLKPNLMELETLSSVMVTDEASLRLACSIMLKKGVKSLLVSLGKHGAMYYDENECFICRPPEDKGVINTTGAGDSLMAGFAFGLIKEKDMRTCLRYAVAAAQITVSSIDTVCKDMNCDLVIQAAEELKIDEQLSGLFD